MIFFIKFTYHLWRRLKIFFRFTDKYVICTYHIKCFKHLYLTDRLCCIGWNSLHFAAGFSKKNVQTLQFLIDNYNGKDIKTIINQKSNYGETPLDFAYGWNKSPIKNEIVSLLRKYGEKGN